jgi:hypothetical protein
MVLAKVYTDGVYEAFHCIAISAAMPSPSSPNSMTDACTGSFEPVRCRTKSAIPPAYWYRASLRSSWRSFHPQA